MSFGWGCRSGIVIFSIILCFVNFQLQFKQYHIQLILYPYNWTPHQNSQYYKYNHNISVISPTVKHQLIPEMKANQKKPRIIIPELIKKKGNKDRDLDINKQNMHGLDNVEHSNQQGKVRSLSKISNSLIVKTGEHGCGGAAQVRERLIKKHSLNHVVDVQSQNVILPQVKFKVSQFLDESNCNQSGLHSISNYHIISNYNSQYNPGQQNDLTQSPHQNPCLNPTKNSPSQPEVQKSQQKDQTQRTSLQTYNQINISNSNLNLYSNSEVNSLKDRGHAHARNRIKTAVELEKLESLLKSDRMFVNPDKWGQYVQRALGDEKFHKALNVFLYSYFIQNYN